MTYFPDTASATAISGMPDAGTVSLSDVDLIERSGLDYRTTLAAETTLARATAAGSRSAALPAVLTGADNDTTVVLTGSGGALTLDATVGDGFRCRVLNNASGGAALPWTTTIPAGASARVLGVSSSLFSIISGSFGSGSVSLGAPIDAATVATLL